MEMETEVGVLTNFFDREGDQTIINIHVASNLHNLCDVLVVEPQNLLVTLLHVLVIQRELDGLALLELNLSGTTLREGQTPFTSEEPSSSLPGCFLGPTELTPLMRPVLISGPLVSRAMATGL